MQIYLIYRIFAIATILLLYGTCFAPISDTHSVNYFDEQSSKITITGNVLFTPLDSTVTYLIDKSGIVNHTWSSNYLPGVAVRWMGEGMILRTIRVGVGPFVSGQGGGVQKVSWDGTVMWDFRYNMNGRYSHHDIELLPNGNVLLVAWETKTRAQTIAAGRNPSIIYDNNFYPDHIIEVQPTGTTTGNIVWEWHVWDHLIQDYDSSKNNYGIVEDHPELIDINYGTARSDWNHINSIDYNEEFNQIMVSVNEFSEIWVIDHSTTTTEAASHTGGNSGKGGDLLYRWGNPQTYRAGIASDQKFSGVHDAHWITRGYPGAGHILVFNNGHSRGYSSVEEIVPPINEKGQYYLKPRSAYEPVTQTWVYTANPPESFMSGIMSGAERLPNGNTLICSAESGIFFEVTSTGSTVWTYTNPYPVTGINKVFKIVYIPSKEESPNQPPYTPRFPNPKNHTTNVSLNIKLSWTGGDPNPFDVVLYDVYFGSSITQLKVATGQSTTYYYPSILEEDMTYYWKIIAWDSNGISSESPLWDFTTESETNNPPNTPTITGETNGAIHNSYDYTIQTTDPDCDEVKYYIDWGDNTTTTTGLYKSGEEIHIWHQWDSKDTYIVKVKAVDEYSTESDWGTLVVTIPCLYKVLFKQIWMKFQERVTNIFLLRQNLTRN